MDSSQYPDEEQYLAQTLEFIDDETERLRDRPPPTAAYREANILLLGNAAEALAHYQKVRPQPYFGRLDFTPEDGEDPIAAYIGIRHVLGYVYSWTAPFAKQLFYADPQLVCSYEAPAGDIRGRITLKRQYEIENAQLQNVTEVYGTLPLADGQEPIGDSSEIFMVEKLSRSRGGELRETVATIRPDQYQQIAAAPEQVMIVQGVAGSGKSIVGLHRIAYLLSPFNDRPEQITASRVVVFGPSRTFLRYVANLLPSLDVQSVAQTTVQDWLRSLLSETVYLNRTEPLLEKLLRHTGKQWHAAYQAAKLKGSIQMSRTLERHVQTRRKQFMASATALAVQLDSSTPILLSTTGVRRVVRSVSSGPPNAQRERLIDRLVEELWATYSHRNSIAGLSTPRRTRREFVDQVKPQVGQQVAVFWPKLDFRQEYRRLLSDSSALAAASGNRMGEQDSATLIASLPRRPKVFQPEDIGALCYLDDLLNKRPNSRFEHVVLDEAQEVSPLELLMIRRHSRGNGFTILGDLAQSLSPQGIASWLEVQQLFRGATVSRYIARTTYRATHEVTRYANRILKKAVPRSLTAVPFPRHGPPPTFSHARTYNEMVAAISRDIRELEGEGVRTIAVLCKSAADAKKLHRSLRDSGIENAVMMDHEDVLSQNVVVAPIYLTRGLEYDAVILAGANKDHYPATSLHSRLLYLAVSRAAYHLRIHWFGQPAPQLGVHHSISRRKKRASKRPNPHHG